MDDSIPTPEEFAALVQVGALIEQTRDPAVEERLRATSTPEEVAPASFVDIWSNRVLWAVFKRGWDHHRGQMNSRRSPAVDPSVRAELGAMTIQPREMERQCGVEPRVTNGEERTRMEGDRRQDVRASDSLENRAVINDNEIED